MHGLRGHRLVTMTPPAKSQLPWPKWQWRPRKSLARAASSSSAARWYTRRAIEQAGREGGNALWVSGGGGTRLSESLCKHNEGSQNKCPVAATPTGADLQLDGGGVRLAAEENAVEVGVERCAETTYKLGTAGAGHHICCNPS